jgi:hypothetical protein
MRNPPKCILAAATIAAPLLAEANTVNYDFTGTVNSASGVYSSAGSTVSGTITIYFSLANPSYSTGTIGDPSASRARVGSLEVRIAEMHDAIAQVDRAIDSNQVVRLPRTAEPSCRKPQPVEFENIRIPAGAAP